MGLVRGVGTLCFLRGTQEVRRRGGAHRCDPKTDRSTASVIATLSATPRSGATAPPNGWRLGGGGKHGFSRLVAFAERRHLACKSARPGEGNERTTLTEQEERFGFVVPAFLRGAMMTRPSRLFLMAVSHLLFAAAAEAQRVSFIARSDLGAGSSPRSVAVGDDFDGDGRPDLAAADSNNGADLSHSNFDGCYCLHCSATVAGVAVTAARRELSSAISVCGHGSVCARWWTQIRPCGSRGGSTMKIRTPKGVGRRTNALPRLLPAAVFAAPPSRAPAQAQQTFTRGPPNRFCSARRDKPFGTRFLLIWEPKRGTSMQLLMRNTIHATVLALSGPFSAFAQSGWKEQ